MSETEIIRDKTDSISVSRTSTGKYSWDVKIYSKNLVDEVEAEIVFERVKLLHEKLRKEYGGEGNV